MINCRFAYISRRKVYMETLLIGRRSYSIGARNSFALAKILYILFFTFTLCVRICPWSQFSPTTWGLGVSLRSPGLAATAFIHSHLPGLSIHIFNSSCAYFFLTFLTFLPIQKENLIDWLCLLMVFDVVCLGLGCVLCVILILFVCLCWYLRQPRLISNCLSNWG